MVHTTHSFVKCFRINSARYRYCLHTSTNFCTVMCKMTRATPKAVDASLDVDSGLGTSTGGSRASPQQPLKEFKDIPGPKGYPIIGNMPENMRDAKILHILNLKRMQTYGEVWKENLGFWGDAVMIANPEGVRDLIDCEGKYPSRMPTPVMNNYYKTTGNELGLFLSQGEQWWAQRQTSSKPLLRPKSVSKYVTSFVEVAQDFVEVLASEKDDVENVKEKLFRWSLESASTVLYNRRFGCLDKNPPEESLKYIQSVHDFFTSTNYIVPLPPVVARIFFPKYWNMFYQSMNFLISVATKDTGERLERKDEVREDTLMNQIIADGKISRKELDAVLTDLMQGSVDTTSNVMHAVLYELASRPDVQEKIFMEISSVVPQWEELTYEKLGSLLYLNGVIKEAMRLYPTFWLTARVLPPEGGVINGYRIPGKTLAIVCIYAMGRNESVFKKATEFIPERWVRSHHDSSLTSHSLAFSPFGHGMRGCVGKRLAMTEMKVLLVEMLRRFKLSTTTKEFNLVRKGVINNPSPIQLTLVERQ